MKLYNCNDTKMIDRLQKISDKCEDNLWVGFIIDHPGYICLPFAQFGFTIDGKRFLAVTIRRQFTSEDDDELLNHLEPLLELCYKETVKSLEKEYDNEQNRDV